MVGLPPRVHGTSPFGLIQSVLEQHEVRLQLRALRSIAQGKTGSSARRFRVWNLREIFGINEIYWEPMMPNLESTKNVWNRREIWGINDFEFGIGEKFWETIKNIGN